MMDYRKIFKEREKRLSFIRHLSFIPDALYLRIVYRIKTGKKLNLKHPVGFNDKMNWLKIHEQKPEYSNYVDKVKARDIVEGIIRVMKKAPDKKIGEDGLPIPPYALYNIGGGTPENLLDFVQILSEELVRAGVLPTNYDFEAHKELVPMQPGDVPVTYADSAALERDFGFKPTIDLRTGLREFAEWYKDYYMGGSK